MPQTGDDSVFAPRWQRGERYSDVVSVVIAQCETVCDEFTLAEQPNLFKRDHEDTENSLWYIHGLAYKDVGL